jgi:hypothetical protein
MERSEYPDNAPFLVPHEPTARAKVVVAGCRELARGMAVDELQLLGVLTPDVEPYRWSLHTGGNDPGYSCRGESTADGLETRLGVISARRYLPSPS